MLANWKLRDKTLLSFSIPTILIFIFSGTVYATTRYTSELFRQINILVNAIIGNDEMAFSFFLPFMITKNFR